MEGLTASDYWRLVNFAIAFTGLVLLLMNTVRTRTNVTMYLGLLGVGLFWYLVAHSLGSIENIRQNNEVGIRTVAGSCGAITILIAGIIGPFAKEPPWVTRFFDWFYNRKEQR